MSEPKITAQFEVDSTGQPTAITRDDTKHYNIRLQVIGAPEDTYAVTYKLHDSYYDPVREVRDKDSSFAERLTSYGDYTVTAKVRSKQGVLSVTVPLSQALKTGHTESMSTAIRAALDEISAK